MKHGAIALHRRLITKFVAMAMFFFLVPQAITYVLSSRSTSAMLLETLRVSLEEKSFLAGADIDRFFSSASVTRGSSRRRMCWRATTSMPSSSI